MDETRNTPEVDVSPSIQEVIDSNFPAEGDDEVEIGRSLMPLRSALARYVSQVSMAPRAAAARGLLPSHAAMNVVRLARQGNPDAQSKIRSVMKLAESDYPDAGTAQQARENLFRAAALEDAGVKVEDEAYTPEEMSESLDDEINALESEGEQVGLGLLPFIGGALAAMIAYFLIKPSTALAAPKDQPKIPVSPQAAAQGFSPGAMEGKKIGSVDQATLDKMALDVRRVFNRVNPATLADTPWDQLDALHLVLPVPSKGRDPKGLIFVRRAAKERLAAAAAMDAAWQNKDDVIVLAPVVIQPAYGPLGISLPSWASNIVSRAASVASGGIIK